MRVRVTATDFVLFLKLYWLFCTWCEKFAYRGNITAQCETWGTTCRSKAKGRGSQFKGLTITCRACRCTEDKYATQHIGFGWLSRLRSSDTD